MKGYQFEDTQGTFHLKKAENISYLYFPIAGEAGLKSSFTPNLGGDAKIDQNTFLLEPVSAENLVNNRNSRNFWCNVKGIGSWSLTGHSAEELSKKFTEMQDDSEVTAGFMWQKTTRESKKYQLRGEILSFIPVDKNVEIMLVTITNTGRMAQTVTPTAAIPLYGRSADNIRDHRHVTSLLHRIETTDTGVLVTPTLSFDERGHQVNHMTYYCVGWSGNGEKPVDFYPTAEDFVGEGGNFERPYAIVKNAEGVKAGTKIEGLEAVGGLHFSEITLEPEEECSYLIFTGITEDIQEIRNLSKTYTTREKVLEESINNLGMKRVLEVASEYIYKEFNMDIKNRSSLAIVNWAFRWCLRLSGVKITYIGEERIPKDQAVLYIGNHRSYFDILMTYVRVPRPTGYVAKLEMLKIPLLSHWMKNLHCLFLDRKDLKQGAKIILAAIGKIKDGISICIFPEGTRNKIADTFLPFHAGSFKIAEKSGCPIIPIALNNAGDVFEDHFPKIKKTHVVIEYGEPIYPNELSKEEKKKLADITLERIKEVYFKNKELV